MPFVEPYGHESHCSSKMLAYAVIIVMDESSMKHSKGDEQGINDSFQNNYDELVDNSTPSCLTYYIPCKTKGFSGGVYFR